jgi:hypothetical protein
MLHNTLAYHNSAHATWETDDEESSQLSILDRDGVPVCRDADQHMGQQVNFTLPEMDAFGRLWFAVLGQAVDDAVAFVPEPPIHIHDMYCEPGCTRVMLSEAHYHRRVVMLWFRSDRIETGSFLWLCSVLGITPGLVLARVDSQRAAQGTHRRRSLRYG